MSLSPTILVERFYFDVWNRGSEAVARDILRASFKFRAALGPERHGPEGFIDCMRSIHAALANYTCVIDDLVVAGNRAAARTTFKGLHRGRFLDGEATGREISWAGGALFATDGEKIVELWVLGDVDSVKQQFNARSQAGSASG